MKLVMINKNSITYKREGFSVENSCTNYGNKKSGLWPHIKHSLYKIIIHWSTKMLTQRLTLQYQYHNPCPQHSISNALVDSPQPLRGYKFFWQLRIRLNKLLRVSKNGKASYGFSQWKHQTLKQA